MVLEKLQAQCDTLTQELDAAQDKKWKNHNRYETLSITFKHKMNFLCRLIVNKLAAYEPYKRIQRNPGSNKTRPIETYWDKIAILFLIDPSPLTKDDLAKLLSITDKGKAFL